LCEFLRRLSKIIHFSRSGSLIVKLDTNALPRIGEKVFDSRLREIGIIHDLFGPVARPYISLTPTTSDPFSLVGKIVYSQ
jgi:RNA-binding protein